MNFLITGLPRSRTSWLAAWLTGAHSLCLHDGLAECDSVAELGQTLRGERRSHGDSDSGLMAVYEEAKRLWPAARWLLVDREFDEAMASLARFAEGAGVDLVVDQRLRTVLRGQFEFVRAAMEVDPMAMIVKYSALNDPEVARSIWRHLLPLVPFDRDRWDILDGLRIEPMPGKMPTTIRAGLREQLLRL